MSLDLDWSLLDAELSARFLETINRALESSASKRPSFIGDISFTGLEFGSHSPDIVIREITDIWSDFVSLDDQPRTEPDHPTRPRSGSIDTDENDEPRENGSVVAATPAAGFGVPSFLPLRTYTQFNDAVPPNRIQGPPSVYSASIAGSIPASLASHSLAHSQHHHQQQQWSAALASRGIRAAGAGAGMSLPTSPELFIPPSSGYFGPWQHSHNGLPPYVAYSSRKSSYDGLSLFGGHVLGPNSSISNVGRILSGSSGKPTILSPPLPASSLLSIPPPPPPPPYHSRPSFRSTANTTTSIRSPSGGGPPNYSSSSSLPSLQLHLSMCWPTTTFRLKISTSLLINYPSPGFMSLPLQLSVTGFVMRAGVIVALEGERRRAHLCLVEDVEEEEEEEAEREATDPVSGAVDRMTNEARSAQETVPTTSSATTTAEASTTTAPTNPAESKPMQRSFTATSSTTNRSAGGITKKPSPGMTILPSLSFESEVGQHDKHVLKNVGKVEKFVAEVLRKGLEDELVFPNYYTIDLPPTKS